MAINKKIILHPLKDGAVDTSVNLFPKTLNTAIVDANGNAYPVSSATNLENGSGSGSLQQLPQDFVLDDETSITAGATNEYAVSLTGKSLASGKRSLAHGTRVRATGDYSHAEGNHTLSSGTNSHAEGLNTTASGNNSHAEGSNTSATGNSSCACGYYTEASGAYSFSVGDTTKAIGQSSVSFGQNSQATKLNTFTQGYGNFSRRPNSSVFGANNKTLNSDDSSIPQFVVGKYNNPQSTTLLEIGNGTNENSRSNAFEVYADGSAKVGLMGNDNLSITTKQYVDTTDTSLQNQINTIKNIGRFLSGWNATTGEATTNPPQSPYTYERGDYFRVTVSGNRKVVGTTYTIGGTNYETITGTIQEGQFIIYDGTTWDVQAGTVIGIENVEGLQSELDGKVDLSSAQTVSGVKTFSNGVKFGGNKNARIESYNSGLVLTNDDAGANFSYGSFNPRYDNTFSLGGTSNYWKDLYLSGSLKDGTNSIAVSSIENNTNKITSISSSSTDTQYPSAKCVWDNLQDVREFAQGKCRTFILSYNRTEPTSSTYGAPPCKKYDGTVLYSWADFSAYVGNNTFSNSIFNSQNDRVDTASNTYYILESGNDVRPFVVTKSDLSRLFNGGDVILVTETDVPDRWDNGNNSFYKLETSKVDLSGYATTGTTQTISGAKTFSNEVSFIDGTGTSQIVNSIGTDSYGGFNIYRSGASVFGVDGGDIRVRNRHLLPENNNTTYSLGSSVARWKDLYINGNLNLLSPNPNYSATIKATNGGYINIGHLQISGVLYSTSNKDLGLSGSKWKDGYFSGTVYADKVEQTSPNWDAGEITLIMAPTETTLTQRYCKVEAINGVLYIVINFELENVSGSAYTIYSGPRCIINNVPSSIGSKIYDFNGKNLTEENVGSSFLMIATNSAYHRIGTEAIYSAIPQQLSTLGVCRGGSGSLNQLIIFPLFTSTTIPAGEKLFFSGRISLTLI